MYMRGVKSENLLWFFHQQNHPAKLPTPKASSKQHPPNAIKKNASKETENVHSTFETAVALTDDTATSTDIDSLNQHL